MSVRDCYTDGYHDDSVSRHHLVVMSLDIGCYGYSLGGGLGGMKESGQLRFGGRDRPFRRPM